MRETLYRAIDATRTLFESEERKPMRFKGKLHLDTTLKGTIPESQVQTEVLARNIDEVDKELEAGADSFGFDESGYELEEALLLKRFKLNEELFRRGLTPDLQEVAGLVNSALTAGGQENWEEQLKYYKLASQRIGEIQKDLDEFKLRVRGYSLKDAPVKWADLEEYRLVDKKLGMVDEFISQEIEALYDEHPEFKVSKPKEVSEEMIKYYPEHPDVKALKNKKN